MSKSIETGATIDLSVLERFVEKEVLPGATARDRAEEFPVAIFEGLHKLGYLQAFIPEALGGMGVPTIDMLSIGRTVAYGSRGVACSMAGHMLSMVPILESGTPELRDRVAADLLKNPSLGSFCFTEPEAGSDVMNIRTRAKKVTGGYELTGRKCFITNARYASHFTVVALLEGAKTPREAMTLFYIPRDAKGLSTGAPLSKLGHCESDTSEVYLDSVFVPEAHRIGGEGKGFDVARRTLARSRTFFAASAVGLCDRARDLSVKFLADREHYGMTLLEQPQIRGQLAQLDTEARAAWYLTCASGAAWDNKQPELQHSSMAKMFAGQVAARYASAALELHGGWGYTREFEVERLYRDAKLFEIIEGPTFVQHAIIAKELYSAALAGKTKPKKAA